MKYITSEIKIKNSNIQQPYLNIKSFSSATIKEVWNLKLEREMQRSHSIAQRWCHNCIWVGAIVDLSWIYVYRKSSNITHHNLYVSPLSIFLFIDKNQI